MMPSAPIRRSDRSDSLSLFAETDARDADRPASEGMDGMGGVDPRRVLYTTGYSGVDVPRGVRKDAALLGLLERIGGVLVDARHTPWSKAPCWRKDVMSDFFGSRYVHVPELGNRNHRGDYGHGIEIVDIGRGLDIVEAHLAGGCPVVVMCACPMVESCHRSEIALAFLRRWAERDGASSPAGAAQVAAAAQAIDLLSWHENVPGADGLLRGERLDPDVVKDVRQILLVELRKSESDRAREAAADARESFAGQRARPPPRPALCMSPFALTAAGGSCSLPQAFDPAGSRPSANPFDQQAPHGACLHLNGRFSFRTSA